MILQGKNYIQKKKITDKTTFLLEFILLIKNEVAVEKHILYTQGKEAEFERKWGKLADVL